MDSQPNAGSKQNSDIYRHADAHSHRQASGNPSMAPQGLASSGAKPIARSWNGWQCWFWSHDWQLAAAIVGAFALVRGLIYLASGTTPIPLLASVGFTEVPTPIWGILFVVFGALQLFAALTSDTKMERFSSSGAALIWMTSAFAVLNAPDVTTRAIGASYIAGAAGFGVMAIGCALIYTRAR